MSYPGDSSLSSDIQERILTTFTQALDLSDKGSRKEALLGCDFVLRLDPLFEPARVLHKRLRDTESEITTEDLRSALTGDGDGAPGQEDIETAEPQEPATADEAADTEASPYDTLAGVSITEQIEAQLEASFGPDAKPPDAETLSPDTELSEPSLSEPSLSVPDTSPAETPASDFESVESAVLGPAGIPLEDDGSDLEAATSEPLGSPSQLDEESERRIHELLEEGRRAFDSEEYQSAIDSWSRVFLIDIDHEEANRRIEDARRMAAEAERQVEEVFHEAMSRLDEGDLESAREELNRVLEMQPTHLAALEYLEKIDAGEVDRVDIPEAPTIDIDAASDLGLGTGPVAEETEAPDDLFAAPDLPPLPEEGPRDSTAPVEAPPPPSPQRRRDPRRLFISVGSAVLVLVLIGGWFLYDNWSLFFPNSQSAQEAPPPPRIDPIRRAQALHEEGKTAIAIAQLRRLPPGDPHYAEAQALVAQWETAAEDAQPRGPSAEDLQRFQALIAGARAAHAQEENLLVSELLDRAVSIAPLDEEAQAMQADAAVKLASLKEQIEIFRSGDWEYALPTLWRMREAEPDNADITRLIVDCYYNLGVRDLQRGRPDSAARKFEEALSLRSDDRTLKRLRAFAQTYDERPEDLLYRIFVKYLPFR